MVVVK